MGVWEQCLSRRSELDAPRSPLQQLLPELPLQVDDLAAERGLGYQQALGGAPFDDTGSPG